MKTRTTPVCDLRPGDRYFAGEQLNPFSDRVAPRNDVREVNARHRWQPSEDYLGEHYPGLLVVWSDDGQGSTGMQIYAPGATVEVIIDDAPPHPLTRQEALEWVYAADAPASLEATERRRNYLEFVYQYSQRNLRKGA